MHLIPELVKSIATDLPVLVDGQRRGRRPCVL